jgi:hypothetical protein
MRAALSPLVVITLLAVSGVAFAHEDPDTEVARRHFNAGRAFYDAADYERALDEFQQARRAKPHPALDFNIGRCLDRLERYQQAIAAYESYAASEPPDALEIRARIVILKDRLKNVPPPAPPRPSKEILLPTPSSLIETSAPAPPPKSNRKTIGIVLGVIGGAVVIGAGVAVGLLVKTTTEPATPDSTGGPHRATE